MSYLVAWSGGADSTWVLHHYAGRSSEDYPIRVLSIDSHRHLSKPFMKAQRVARKNYLDLSKKRGYHIQYEKITVGGNWHWGKQPDSFRHGSAQPLIWLSALVQAANDGDIVLMGYIQGDVFWHIKDMFEESLIALCKLKGVNVTIEYPVEYDYKADILRRLKKDRVPESCWFSCEDTEDGKPCGSCVNCESIEEAKANWRYKQDQVQLEEGKK